MKKIVFLLVFLTLSVPCSAYFSDVSIYHENNDAISYVEAEGIVVGYEDGTFRPDQAITRAEFTKIVLEAYFDKEEVASCIRTVGLLLGSPVIFYWDVGSGQWYANYVCYAANNAIIKGYPNGSFKPDQNINFAEAAKIISNSAGMEYADSDPWFRGYVDNLANAGAIPVSIDGFDKEITRGEMAEIIYRLKKPVTDKESRTFVGMENGPVVEEEHGDGTDETCELEPVIEEEPVSGCSL